MKLRSLAAFLAAAVGAPPAPVSAGELAGPARFCGYSPIIDLLDGESVTTLQGGIHGGSFRWDGAFGSLEVYGIGWAGRPKGRIVSEQSDLKPARFAQRRTNGHYKIAIWNGRHGAAYFTSDSRFSLEKIAAIDRVRLFEESETPEGCKLRTVFSWN